MEERKPIPKRIVCITQFEDASIVCSFFGCRSRQDYGPLLMAADRQARKKLATGVPLCPEESAKKENK